MITRRIDNKHEVQVDLDIPLTKMKIEIVKFTNGQPIPENEPIILFRGRDRLALPMLRHYRQLCQSDGATDFQLESMDDMVAKFQKFADENPVVMKQPGITRGL